MVTIVVIVIVETVAVVVVTEAAVVVVVAASAITVAVLVISLANVPKVAANPTLAVATIARKVGMCLVTVRRVEILVKIFSTKTHLVWENAKQETLSSIKL